MDSLSLFFLHLKPFFKFTIRRSYKSTNFKTIAAFPAVRAYMVVLSLDPVEVARTVAKGRNFTIVMVLL